MPVSWLKHRCGCARKANLNFLHFTTLQKKFLLQNCLLFILLMENYISRFIQLQESKQVDEVENVRVVVRVRPLETNAGKNTVVCDKNNRTVTVQKPNTSTNEPPKVYQFDSVFGEDSTQVRWFYKYRFSSATPLLFVVVNSITMVAAVKSDKKSIGKIFLQLKALFVLMS